MEPPGWLWKERGRICLFIQAGCWMVGALDEDRYTPKPDSFTKLPSDQKWPTVFVSVLVRNEAHGLPYFLGNLEKLSYPKDRIHLWIRSDHNQDNTVAVLNKWISAVQGLYYYIDFLDGEVGAYEDERGPLDWSPNRMQRVIELREEALNNARELRLDYFLTIDADNFLVRPDTLAQLMSQNKTIVSPMLTSDQPYANFWGGMGTDGFYQRTKLYRQIREYEIKGCFQVPMVHSTVLVNLHSANSAYLTYDPRILSNFSGRLYAGPIDDSIVFAKSAQLAGLQMWILNSEAFGLLMVPLDEMWPLEAEVITFQHFILEGLENGIPGIIHSTFVPPVHPAKDGLGLDEIYLINLERRVDRRRRMQLCFDLIGVNVRVFPAVDSRTLTSEHLAGLGVKLMPGYQEPYHGRTTMTLGEIACFLSHYSIWEDMVTRGLNKVLVFEDDIRFEINFKKRISMLLTQAEAANLDWDLIYIGRKRMEPDKDGPFVAGSTIISHVSYSYWCLSYLLTFRGALKLLAGNPLKRMVPVDEYIPIMFNKHPNQEWVAHFPIRDLVAYSAEPLMVYPTHYSLEPGHFSETESSNDVIDGISGSNGGPMKSDDHKNVLSKYKSEL